MRELLARGIAILTGLLVISLAVVFALIQNPDRTRPAEVIPGSMGSESTGQIPGEGTAQPSGIFLDEEGIEAGRQVYRSLGCAACHSIDGEGNLRNPLDGVGRHLTAEDIRGWIVSPGEIDPDIRKPDYSNLSQDEFDALVNFLQSLK